MILVRWLPGLFVACLMGALAMACVTPAPKIEKMPPATAIITGLAWKDKTSPNVVRMDWRELTERMPGLTPGAALRVTNLNTGTAVAFSVPPGEQGQPKSLDLALTPGGGSAVALRIEVAEPNPANAPSFPQSLAADSKARVDWLTPASAIDSRTTVPMSWPRLIGDSVLAFRPRPADLGPWSYEAGFMAEALFELGERTGDAKYSDYARAWIDGWLAPDGRIQCDRFHPGECQLDNILPGRLALRLYEKTGDGKYRKAAEQLIDLFKTQPRTPQGGFWHKKKYVQQMWLDGIYMGDTFLAQAGRVLSRPDLSAEAVHQAELIYDHTFDRKTGLLYHGWDASGKQVWADAQTGASPEFWGRSIGWYVMALADMLEDLPQDGVSQATLASLDRGLTDSLERFQDPASGLWYQVIDKGGRMDNWPESSATAMFIYGIAKGVRRGCLARSSLASAQKAWRGLLDREMFMDTHGRLWLLGTVQVGSLSGKGDYAYYVGVPRTPNDLKGLAALLFAAMEIDSHQTKP